MAAKKKPGRRKQPGKSAREKAASGVAAGRKSKAVSAATTTVRKLMLEDLARSGLTSSDAKRMGCEPATAATFRKSGIGFGNPKGYRIPYHDIDGNKINFARTKFIGGKYRQPKNSRPHFYYSKLLRRKWRKIVKDPKQRLYIVEGEKKADRACKEGFPTIGIGGVWCWKYKKEPLRDFDDIDWTAREIVIVFDSDIADKPAVLKARNALARELRERGAAVLHTLLPSEGSKVGLDDYLVAHGKAAFEKLAKNALEVPPDWVDNMNARHFVAQEGTKVFVFEDGEELSALGREDFKSWYMNEHVQVGDSFKRLGDAWLEHPERRQYRRVVFDPTGRTAKDIYNRWPGMPVEPIEGDWSPLKSHIRDNLCNSNDKYFNYLLHWLAFGVQNPARPTEVAVVLSGEQGTGKGVFARAYGSLFAPHFYHASSPEEVVGRFNGHLREKLVVFLDEAFYAGDKAHIGALKRLITEPTLSIEVKYRDRVETPNRLKVIVASNEHWVIPAGMSERRFFVLAVAPHRKQDTTYFGAIAEQLGNGGYEAMMYDLLHTDLSNFNSRTCPRTEALADQQVFSLDPIDAYWAYLLEEGVLPGKQKRKMLASKKEPLGDWGAVPKAVLYDDFCDRARQRGLTRLPDIRQFGKRLKKLLPPGYPQSKKLGSAGHRTPVWVFPRLSECRKVWERILGRVR